MLGFCLLQKNPFAFMSSWTQRAWALLDIIAHYIYLVTVQQWIDACTSKIQQKEISYLRDSAIFLYSGADLEADAIAVSSFYKNICTYTNHTVIALCQNKILIYFTQNNLCSDVLCCNTSTQCNQSLTQQGISVISGVKSSIHFRKIMS